MITMRNVVDLAFRLMIWGRWKVTLEPNNERTKNIVVDTQRRYTRNKK
jgi:hypothetical protein